MKETDGLLDAVYEAMEREDPEAALALVEQAKPEELDGPEPHFLAGVALESLDRPREAVGYLRNALSFEPEDASCQAWLARALFHSGQFVEAEEESHRALHLDADLPEAHEVRGMILERRQRYGEADQCLARAAELDADNFPVPTRLSWEEFERAVAGAREKLPEPFRVHLDQVVLMIEDLPADALVQGDAPIDPETLGLFDGAPLGDAREGELPARIFLFQRNLERHAAHSELTGEIAVTLYHELGHYLGLDEEEVEDIGLA